MQAAAAAAALSMRVVALAFSEMAPIYGGMHARVCWGEAVKPKVDSCPGAEVPAGCVRVDSALGRYHRRSSASRCSWSTPHAKGSDDR